MTEQYVGAPVDELAQAQQDEIARLQTLVEAAGRLLATLDLDEVLPQILELARHSLAADAYALWRHDVRRDEWALQAVTGLSDAYVAEAGAAIRSNTSQVSLTGPLAVEDIANTEWLTPEHRAAHAREGNAAFRAIPLHHQADVIGTLVFYYRSKREFGDVEIRSATAVGRLAAAAIGTTRVYAEQQQLGEDRVLLAEVSELLAASLDYEAALGAVAARVVGSFADLCNFYVAEGDELVRVTVAHVEPETTQLYAERVPERFAIDAAATAPGIQAYLRREPILIPDAGESFSRDLVALGMPEEVVAQLGVGSALVVPLVARERALGFALFGARRVGRYTQHDVQLGMEIARRAAVAIDNARLYESALERERKLRFVAESGEVLASSLDYDATLWAVARLVVGELADWCIVDVVEGTEIRRVTVAAIHADQQEALQRLRDEYPPTWDSPQPAAHALREAEPVLFAEFDDELLRSTTFDDRHYELMRTLSPSSAIATPLVARGETVGAITLAWSRSGKTYSEQDLQLVEEVARRVALAVDSARLYARERVAGEQLEFLAEAGSVLASSLDYETTLENVAKLVVPRFADWCAVDALDENGAVRRIAVVHRDPAKLHWAVRSRDEWAPTLEEPEGTARVIRSGSPALYHRITDELLVATARTPEQLEVLRELGMASALVVPLAARGRTLGALMLVSADPVRLYTDHDLDFAEDLARRAGVAVDNAQLYGRSRELVALLDTLYATAPVGFAFFDRDLRYRRVNEYLAELNGIPVADHIGRTLPEVLPNLDRAGVDHLRRTLVTGDHVEFQISGETPAQPGVQRHWDAVYYPVHAADGEILGVGAVVQDVTQRRAAETALRLLAEAGRFLGSSLNARAMLQSLAELIVPELADWAIVHLLDEDGRLERVAAAARDGELKAVTDEIDARWPATRDQEGGPAAVIRSGSTRSMNDVTDADLVAAARDADHLELLRRTRLRSFASVPMQARERTLGVLTLASQRPARYGDDELALAVALAGRAALAADNALLFHELGQRAQSALALAFVGDGVFLVDEAGVIRLWNTAASIITGLPAAATVGVRAADAIPGWSAIAARSPVSAAPEVPRAATIPVELHGGERWLSISGVSFPGGTVYAFRDLTDEQRVERLKSEFVSTISHELRTPLAAIYGAALTLRRDDPALEPQRDGLLDVIAAEADRLARIVNDILWASRLESGTLHVAVESCDAKQLVGSVADAARAHLPPKIALHVDVARRLPPVAADADKVRQVLTNLVDNAIKYSPDGGDVRVDVRREGTRIAFRVSDEGLGIPLGEQTRIFDKFYRLDPELTRGIGGTGLGLYITRELVRRMGGDVAVESAEGIGSTFTVELPVATSP